VCDDDWGEGSATPEEAARGDVPERYFTVLGVQVDGDEAVVWSLTNDRPPFEASVDNCVRHNGQWYVTDGSGGLPAGAGTPWEIRDKVARIEESFKDAQPGVQPRGGAR
jgi:hypothetical protein